MKRNILLLLVALLSVVANAYNAKIKGIYYNFSEDNAIVTYRSRLIAGYESDYFGTVVIPKSVTYNGKTYNVTGIGEGSFWNCTNLTSVTIPEGVTSIGNGAFDGCSSLTSITIPSSVTRISSGAFEDCSSLTSISVALMNMNYDSRDNCNAIIETATNTLIAGCQNTIIPNSVTRIGNGVFSSCSSLTSITIPNSVTSIGAHAFFRCSSLTSITIPNSVTSIGDNAFAYCYFKTESFVNNSSLTSDGNWGAALCDEETNDGLLIKDNVVVGCRPWATSVTIPESVTSIGSYAFKNCKSLTSVTIPNSVTNIGDNAFAYCYFKTESFVNNSSLTNDGNWGATLYDEDTDDGLLIKDNAVLLCRPWATSVTIPESVTSIREYSFYGCSSLTSITIPNSVTSIGNSALYACI